MPCQESISRNSRAPTPAVPAILSSSCAMIRRTQTYYFRLRIRLGKPITIRTVIAFREATACTAATVLEAVVPRPSRFPLSSTARTTMFVVPCAVGVQKYIQDSRPLAGCQVEPPSIETSTPPTTPPPASVAVPVTVTGIPAETVPPGSGNVIEDVGAKVSEEAEAGVRGDCNVAGCTP